MKVAVTFIQEEVLVLVVVVSDESICTVEVLNLFVCVGLT